MYRQPDPGGSLALASDGRRPAGSQGSTLAPPSAPPRGSQLSREAGSTCSLVAATSASASTTVAALVAQ